MAELTRAETRRPLPVVREAIALCSSADVTGVREIGLVVTPAQRHEQIGQAMSPPSRSISRSRP
jgi:hypothetical protein